MISGSSGGSPTGDRLANRRLAGRLGGVVTAIHAAAARNNAEWCAAVCRSHGIPSVFGVLAWHSADRAPVYYPDAVTLRPDATSADVLARIDTSVGCSVKDSFGALDLAAHGFAELFAAQWIQRRGGLRVSATSLSARPVASAAELRDWQSAWHGGDGAPDVFRPGLLGDPSVRVLGLRRGAATVGGVVLNRGGGLVGMSNLFAVEDTDIGSVWSTAIAAAGECFPGLPVVGYAHGDALAQGLASGFRAVGSLRVWVR